jgi:glycine/D-amino acid oxidase-like deaminating enzyme
MGVKFRYGEKVLRINTSNNAVTGVMTVNRTYIGDKFVFCTATSVSLLMKLRINVPVFPMKVFFEFPRMSRCLLIVQYSGVLTQYSDP